MTELLDRHRLASEGVGWRRVAELRRQGSLLRLRPGIFVRAEQFTRAPTATRALLRAHALAATTHEPGVFSHTTAAAAHGLPVVRTDDRVHTTDIDARGAARVGVVRHRGPLADDDIVRLGPLRCTSLARTLADLARTAPCETSIAAMDAALRAAGPNAQALRETVGLIARRSAHGVSRAMGRLAFADGGAESPGESISRIHLVRVGFRVRTQIVVAGPRGREYRVDFEIDDVLGEFDGAAKYSDPNLLGGRTPEQALLAEKRREDEIRGVTQRRLVRWQWPEIASSDALENHLRGLGVRPRQTRGAFLTLGTELGPPW
ncbi:hypothetical protein [Microbacterium oleivorans]|uniref:Type IV toxin-antitoxin system AbiEi family antitoxin domain-containing protein n=1 Tax=Microbacterium oleivorans TaxID=273677 RepID=A0A7D5ITW5_9MICO|nr:hypothetical protein [Microbacterium oleivorans]QLD12534.1 hypothetical protein HW566_12600 [Microbacterium oleivorans]